MLHSVLCRIRGYVVWHYVSFGVMSFGNISYLAVCRIRTNVVLDCVVWHNVVRPTVDVSASYFCSCSVGYRQLDCRLLKFIM